MEQENSEGRAVKHRTLEQTPIEQRTLEHRIANIRN